MFGGWDIKRILSSDFFLILLLCLYLCAEQKTYLWQKKKSIR